VIGQAERARQYDWEVGGRIDYPVINLYIYQPSIRRRTDQTSRQLPDWLVEWLVSSIDS